MKYIIILICIISNNTFCENWEMWHKNAKHTNFTSEQLTNELSLLWVREFSKPRTAWTKSQTKLQFDNVYEPVVKDKLIYISSMNTDSVTAFDTETGIKKWIFYTNAPVRFAPVIYKNKIFFGSDDGYLYCLNNITGKLIKKIKIVPSTKMIIGNDRLIGMYPVRGAPVIDNGIIYFATGLFPFMGTFISAINADSLEKIWCNSGDGSTYTIQQHNTPAFAGVAPQGYLTVSDDYLLVSGGRSTPAVFNKNTGALKYFKPSSRVFGKSSGGFAISAISGYFANSYGIYDIASGDEIAKLPMGVYEQNKCYYIDKNKLASVKLDNLKVKYKDVVWIGKKGRKIILNKLNPQLTTKIACDKIFLKAGNTIYTKLKNTVQSIVVDKNNAKIAWQYKLKSKPFSMIVADKKLFVSTENGSLYCFGENNNKDKKYHFLSSLQLKTSGKFAKLANSIIEESGNKGYAIALGIGSGELIKELIKNSEYHILVIENDPNKIKSFRHELDACGVYGSRIAVIAEKLSNLELPAYMANLIFAELAINDMNQNCLNSLRPYGGTLFLRTSQQIETIIKSANIANLEIKTTNDFIIAKRIGSLPGSANWTHQAADSANTMKSNDSLPNTPLGLLWFGGPSNDAVLPRHGHGPSPQVIGGRLFIEGKDMIRAVDVYTGRLLWQKEILNLGIYYNNTAHHHGANGIGSNFVSTKDGIYVMLPQKCIVLSPETGKVINVIEIPEIDGRKDLKWGNIRVYKNYLIATVAPIGIYLSNNKSLNIEIKDINSIPTPKINANYGAGSQYMVVFDRQTGKSLWTKKANFNFRHNAIAVADNKVFCIDSMTKFRKWFFSKVTPIIRARALIYALDIKTGKSIWEKDENVFGTWLAYSKENDILVQAGIAGRDRATDEVEGVGAINAENGEELWFNKTGLGRIMLYHNQIIGDESAVDIKTGTPIIWENPINNQKEKWTYHRNYGCNASVASENLLTFRSGAAGYYNLKTQGGTGNLGGFKSGCTSNLIAADGVLNAPDYTRTCECSYQLQTSLALIYMPEVEMWTWNKYLGADGDVYSMAENKNTIFNVNKIGVNFGASGDRLSENKTLWINYPHDNSPSPALDITLNNDVTYTRQNSIFFTGNKNWISSSFAENAKKIEMKIANAATFTVKLYFSEYSAKFAKTRVFDVSIQGKKVLKIFNIAKFANGINKGIVKEFKNIKIDNFLKIELKSISGKTLISGIEVSIE